MLQFYKPNRGNTGAACSFSFNSKEQCLFVEFVKQTGWNESERTGSFKGGEKANAKFSLTEIGGLLLTCEKLIEFSTFHKSAKNNSQIHFAPFYEKTEGDQRGKLRGLGLRITRTNLEDSSDKQTFSIGLAPSEFTVLREFLKFSLDHIFSALYAEDKKRRQEFFDRKQKEEDEQAAAPAKKASGGSKKSAPPAPEQEEQIEIEDDPFASE
jgi:hypothetical protein